MATSDTVSRKIAAAIADIIPGDRDSRLSSGIQFNASATMML
jgi:hypothetical protein